MTKNYLSLIILLFCVSCQPKIDTRNCTYTQYRFYRLFKDDFKIGRISYQTIDVEKVKDSLLIYKIREDSIYLALYDTIESTNYSHELRIYINKDSLASSYAKRGNYEFSGKYVLTLIKRHRIDNRVYKIYRFDHDFDGDDGRNAIFFTYEFGVIAEFDYDKGGLSKLTEIKGFENKDYLTIIEKILDDSVFLFSPRDEL